MRNPVYKIVKKENRCSFNFNPIRPNKYKFTYEKDKVVESIKGSFGIFCFRRKKDAINYIASFYISGLVDDTLIIRVEPIGIGKVPKIVSSNVEASELEFFMKILKQQIQLFQHQKEQYVIQQLE